MGSAIVFADGATLVVAPDPQETVEHLTAKVEVTGYVRFDAGGRSTFVRPGLVAYVRPLNYDESAPGA